MNIVVEKNNALQQTISAEFVLLNAVVTFNYNVSINFVVNRRKLLLTAAFFSSFAEKAK
jgi:hypothetical protein